MHERPRSTFSGSREKWQWYAFALCCVCPNFMACMGSDNMVPCVCVFLQGMNYLHLCSIMHRDLKSGNVLLDAHGTVKISDFGLSCVLEIGHASADLTAETGTYRWMAPEVIRHEPYSTKADVYSFGVVLWEMITKDQPFRGMTPIQGSLSELSRGPGGTSVLTTMSCLCGFPSHCSCLRRCPTADASSAPPSHSAEDW